MGTPLISIVIPTKNRYKYLIEALESFLLLKNDDFEVVVQDNSDNNSFILEYLKCHEEYFFLKYFYCGNHLSMSENSDLAISHSIGEYVCFLGDDDTVTDKIFEVAQYMKENNCDSCLGNINRFNWQDYRDNHVGAVAYKSYNFKGEFKNVSINLIIEDILRIGATEMLNLPRVYHGMVKRTLLDRIKEQTGTFFPGPSPDMASAVAISSYANKHIQTDIPFIISGFSFNSGGGQGKGGHHGGDIRKVGYLPKTIMDMWDERIPQFFSGLTIWPITFLYAMKICGKEDKCDELNFNYIYANLYISHFNLMRTAKCESVSLIKVIPQIVASFFSRGIQYVLRKIKPNCVDKEFIIVNSVNTLSEALAFEIDKNNTRNE